MEARLTELLLVAAEQHGVLSRAQLTAAGVGRKLRESWLDRGLLAPRGPSSYVVGGSPPTWRRDLWCAQFDVLGCGFLAGRSAARLHRLDGFAGSEVEVLVSVNHRGLRLPWVMHATSTDLNRGDTVTVSGLRCLNPMQTILRGTHFGFSRTEFEQAIDSAIRLRLISADRLRAAVAGVRGRGSRALIDAIIDLGGESALEREFLRLLRQAGLAQPVTQCVVRVNGRFAARVDFAFAHGLHVELEGHEFHSSRAQRAADERRRNELRLVGKAPVVFTWHHVFREPDYVVAQMVAAAAGRAA